MNLKALSGPLRALDLEHGRIIVLVCEYGRTPERMIVPSESVVVPFESMKGPYESLAGLLRAW